MVVVVMSFFGFRLPRSAFYRVLLIGDGRWGDMLYVVESSATSQLVSEDRCSVSGGLSAQWVGCCLIQGPDGLDGGDYGLAVYLVQGVC